MQLSNIYEVKVRPRLSEIEKWLIDEYKESIICEKLGIGSYEWKQFKHKYADLFAVIEKVQGPKSDYHLKIAPFFDRIQKWLQDGLADHQIAEKLGIKPRVLLRYKGLYPDFCELIFEGREQATDVVENAIFKSATGFEYEEKKELIERGEVVTDDNGNIVYLKNSDNTFKLDSNNKKIPKTKPGKVRVEKITKQQVPNIQAATLWVTNKRSKDWSVRRDNNMFFDPQEAAKVIKETLNDMEETIPNKPPMTFIEEMRANLTKAKPEDLKALKETIDSLVEM